MQPVGKRTRVVVRKVGPWSVLKFSLLFYLCVMLIVYFALMIIYGLLSAVERSTRPAGCWGTCSRRGTPARARSS